MNRRKFLRNASLIAAGVVAADQLEILERLTWKQKYWAGADLYSPAKYEVWVSQTRGPIIHDQVEAVVNGTMVKLDADGFIAPGSLITINPKNGRAQAVIPHNYNTFVPYGIAYMGDKKK